MSVVRTLLGAAVLSAAASVVQAFDMSRSDNVVAYWGQNSVGASGGDASTYQKSLGEYCDDDSVDTFPLSFLTVYFSTGNMPEINFANTCNGNDNAVFSGTALANCSFLEADIKKCQAAGKTITLSIGGATGGNVFTDDTAAKGFADQIWNLFLGGTSDTRPLGNTPLDGVDLDIEGGSSAGYAAFVTQLQSHFKGADKKYYISGAPQCPFPDAYLGDVLNSVPFDAVYIQFYNNYCGVNNFGNANAWNWQSWEDWATNTSPNKDVKLYVGVPAATGAANAGSYVDAATVVSIANSIKSNSSHFGGVMFWDISQAVNNNNFQQAIKSGIKDSSDPSTSSSASSTVVESSSTEAVTTTTVASSSTTVVSESTTAAPTSTPPPAGSGEGDSSSSEVPTTTDDPCPEETSSAPVTETATETSDPCPEETTAAPTSTDDPCPEETSSASATAATTTGTGSSTGGSSDCSGAAAWSANTVYTGGQYATSGGKTYQAKWWTQGEDPASSTSGVWVAASCGVPRRRAALPRATAFDRINPHAGSLARK